MASTRLRLDGLTGADWSGTASVLLTNASAQHAGAAVTNEKTWPSTPRALSGRLRRAATFLRTVGIHIDFDQKVGRNRTRLITIATGPDQSVPSTSAPSAPVRKGSSQRRPRWWESSSSLKASDGVLQPRVSAVGRLSPVAATSSHGADGQHCAD